MSLLSFLFGGGHTTQNTPPHQWGYDSDGYLTSQAQGAPQMGSQGPQVAMAPQQAPNPSASPVTPSSPTGGPSSAINSPLPGSDAHTAPVPDPNDPNAITIQGDPWKPKHTGILGQIADYILGTHINRGVVRQNMEGALEHINSNPQEAIARMAKFDPQTAMELYSKVASEQHWNAMADRSKALTDMQITKGFMPIAAGIMNRIGTDANGQPLQNIDPNAWATAKHQLMTIGQHYGMTPDQINDLVPDTPDPNVAATLAAGNFPVYRQASLAEKTTNDQGRLTVSQANERDHNIAARAAATQAANGSKNAQSNAERAGADVTAVGNKQDDFKTLHGQARTVILPDGSHGVTSPDGMTMMRNVGGQSHLYRRGSYDPKTGKTDWVLQK